MLKRTIALAAATALVGIFVVADSASAARKTCPDGSYPPCNKPPVGEVASNNLSFPVIWSEGILKPGFVLSTAGWLFQPVLQDAAGDYYTDIGQGPVYCVGETDITPPQSIPPEVLCYYGRLNEGIAEDTGEPVFSGEKKIWWLQQRQPQNAWQIFSTVDPEPLTPVTVTGVDTGDLLESSISIKAKQIRTEFTLFKNVDSDPDFSGFLSFANGGCVLDGNDPAAGTSPSNCFAAHSMSGAVPGTDQSIAETQGTDFPAAETLLDPRDVKMAKNYFDPDAVALAADAEPDPRIVPIEPPLGMDATVFSACARLIIQKISGDTDQLYWDSVEGSWMPRSAINSPAVDINAWGGSYSAEINAGGSLIYGYNWNTKSFAEGAGDYRLTFLLEGGPSDGGRCIHELNTEFDDSSLSVNVGERRPATMLSKNALAALGATRGEGGAVYVDVALAVGGGGGGKKK